MVLAFAGHRPEKLPWGENEGDERCAALKTALAAAVVRAAEEGYDTFLCGMARGCDFYFAEAVEMAVEAYPHLRLEAWLPCPSQSDRWPEIDRARQEKLLLECAAVYMVEPRYSEGCMLRRNRAMIDRADALLTVWDGSPGGTEAAVRYAGRLGKEIRSLWL